MARKAKDPALAESGDDVALARKDMHLKSIEYCQKLNEFQGSKRLELMENVGVGCYSGVVEASSFLMTAMHFSHQFNI